MAKGLKELLADYEKTIVSQTLARNGGDKARTAVALQISRRALDKMVARHRLCKPRFTRALPIQPMREKCP